MRNRKKLHNAEKLKKENCLKFLNFQFAARHQKNEEGHSGDKKFGKRRTVPKTLMGDPIVSYAKN